MQDLVEGSPKSDRTTPVQEQPKGRLQVEVEELELIPLSAKVADRDLTGVAGGVDEDPVLAMGDPEGETGAGGHTLQMLSTLLVFISTDTHPCMTVESNARGLLFDNPTNANEGMQAITKGRYGLQLGNGTGVPEDHVIHLHLNVDSADHDSRSIDDVAEKKLFDSTASGGMGITRLDYDRILFFAPDGITDAGFTAYAIYPYWIYDERGMKSVYGGNYGNGRMNGFLHELGHNFGFNHSAKGWNQYGDRTCVMGLSRDATKTETYGVSKLLEAGWLDVFPHAEAALTGDTTLDLYPLSSDPNVVEETIAVAIPGTDYYVAYHRDDRPYGYLSQAGDRDKVFVYSYTTEGGEFDPSYQLANLSPGESYYGPGEIRFERYGDSNEYATVSFDLDDGNSKPVVADATFGTSKNEVLTFELTASDADDDALTFEVVEAPLVGVLSGTAPNLTYTPPVDFLGQVDFIFRVDDGLISTFANASIQVYDSPPEVEAGPDRAVAISGEVSWTPAETAGLVGWYDASDGSTLTVSAGAVSVWADKSGNHHHAEQSTASKQPQWTGDRLDFSGSQILKVSNDAFKDLQNPAVIAVTKRDSSRRWGNAVASWHGENGNGWQVRQLNWSERTYTFTTRDTSGADDPDSGTMSALGVPHMFAAYRMNDDTRAFRLNGLETMRIADTGTIGYTDGYSSIGGVYSNDAATSEQNHLDGSIYELVVLNDSSEMDVEKLEGYLVDKWGLASELPAEHAYKEAAPSLAGTSVTLGGDVIHPDGIPTTTTWSQVSGPGPGAVAFADASAVETTATFREAGTYVLRLTAFDGFFEISDDITINVVEALFPDTDGDGMDDDWELANFGDLSQGPDEDFDGDGVPNLLEVASGTSPIDGDSRVALPEGTIMEASGSDYMMLTYRRLAGGSGITGVNYTVNGLTYTVEYDGDLMPPWSSGSVVQVGDAVNNGDGTETVTVRLPAPVDAETKQFMRLRVIPSP